MESYGDAAARVLDGLRAYASGRSALGRELARHLGMHTTDSAAIVEVLRAEEVGRPLTPARLAERIGLSSGATSILLGRLEAAGHVTRTREHRDRRLVTLRSTPAVHDAAEAFSGPLRARCHEVLGRWSAAELDLVASVVAALNDAVDAYPPPDDGESLLARMRAQKEAAGSRRPAEDLIADRDPDRR